MSNAQPPLHPVVSFSELPLSDELKAVVTELGFEAMTPIQAQSIPMLLEGHDLIGQSKTGSGKTAAFSLPILERLHMQTYRPQALILTPTRELGAQVAREIRRLGRRHPGLKVLVLSGGEPVRVQASALEAGVHILVATPGRLLDHLERGNLVLTHLRTLVLDEADRMLEMGFRDDIEAILSKAPRNRQTVLFSATFPDAIEELSARYQNQAQRVTIGDGERTADKVRQILLETSAEQKLSSLHWILREHRPEAAIVFSNHKAAVSEICTALASWGVSTTYLHGEMEQIDRDKAMAKLRNGSIRVLVATDVAARGIDVAGLDLVVNYDLPVKPDIYVHRIGRTGRAGQRGLAISLATPKQMLKVQAIEEYTGKPWERQRASAATGSNYKTSALFQAALMTTLRIGGGRKDKLRPGDILGALTGEAGGLAAHDIGKIEIHDRIAYVAVSQSIGRMAIQRLQQGKIKGRKFSVDLMQ